jgi:hypothetical protein
MRLRSSLPLMFLWRMEEDNRERNGPWKVVHVYFLVLRAYDASDLVVLHSFYKLTSLTLLVLRSFLMLCVA